jgi:hypothetical protein
MKAKMKFENGWLIEINPNNNSPMLLLEWVSEFPNGKMPLVKVIIDNGMFKIHLNTSKKEIEKCVRYINNNL